MSTPKIIPFIFISGILSLFLVLSLSTFHQEDATHIFLQTANEFQVNQPEHTGIFTENGIQFINRKGGPFWKWNIEFIGSEKTQLVAPKDHNVAPEVDTENSIAYQRGSITEKYIVKEHSIEQQFILNENPMLSGNDLLIKGRIKTNGRFESQNDAWAWRKGSGVVSLGNVFVFDAVGTKLPAEMIVHARTTEIRVDGNALAMAHYPVTIDPEIGTNDQRISDVGNDGSNTWRADDAAVAFNHTDSLYLVVWDADDNLPGMGSNENEIFGQFIDIDGNEVGTNDFRISNQGPPGSGSYQALSPSVAWNSIENQFLVVWIGDHTAASEDEIFGQLVNGSSDSLVGAAVKISTMGIDGVTTIDAAGPDVTYNAAENEYFVVWSGDDILNGDNEIYGQRISNVGLEIGVDDIRISDVGPDTNATYQGHDPAVTWNSTENEYLVVWDADETPSEEEIYGQLLDSIGNEIGTNDFRISTAGPNGSISYDAEFPDVAYNETDNEYLVVWAGDDDSSGVVQGEDEIFGQRISNTGAEIGNDDFRISAMGSGTGYDATNPTIAWNSLDNTYYVAWHSNDTTGVLNSGEDEIFGQLLDASGALVGTYERLSDMGTDGDAAYDGFDPAVAYNPYNNQFLIAFEGDEDIAPLVNDETEIFIQRWTSDTLACNPPAVSGVPSTAAGCSGDSALFMASVSGDVDSVQWQFSLPTDSIWTDLTDTPPYSGTTTMNLNISPMDTSISGWSYRLVAYGCGGSDISSSALLTVYPTPEPPIIMENNDTLYVSPVIPGAVYEWIKNGSTAGVFDTVYVPGVGGTFEVEVTDPNGCQNISAPWLLVGLPVEVAPMISIWPNPTTDHLWVDLEFSSPTLVELKLINLSGQTVKFSAYDSPSQHLETQITDRRNGKGNLCITHSYSRERMGKKSNHSINNQAQYCKFKKYNIAPDSFLKPLFFSEIIH